MDPVFRGPFFGSIFMSLCISLIGVILFLQKKSLLGEALSHASFPGVILGAFLGNLISVDPLVQITCALIGAFIFSYLGTKSIEKLVKKKVHADSALCFTLSIFFGLGILFASYLQQTHSILYRSIQNYLYGQTATLSDFHVYLYMSLSLVFITFLIIFYRPIHAFLFHREYAKTLNLPVKFLESILTFWLALTIVCGIRSVGVVLISGLLIAPAVIAKQLSKSLKNMFLFAGIFGCLSACIGNMISLQCSITFYPLSVPTGPSIVFVATFFALFALLFAPKKGVVFRYIRVYQFKKKCFLENLLKSLWKQSDTLQMLAQKQQTTKLYLFLLLRILKKEKLIQKKDQKFVLTHAGLKKAAYIVRLHRLWELYLVHSLGVQKECVHKSAEEMEHILTPELEKRLSEFLEHPQKDPHQQPIPKIEVQK